MEFEEGDVYSMDSFEPFVSDANSMLILGAPIEFAVNEANDMDFFNEDRATKVTLDIRQRTQTSSDTDEISRSSLQSSRVKFRDRDSTADSQQSGLPFDVASFGFLSDEDDNSLVTEFNSTARHQHTPAANFSSMDNDICSSPDPDDHETNAEVLPSQEAENNNSQPKPKKLRKKRKKRIKASVVECEGDSESKHTAGGSLQPVAPAGEKKPSTTSAIGTKRAQYVAPKPTNKVSIFADAEIDGDFKKVSIMHNAPKKPVLHVPAITSNIEREVKPTQGYNLQKQYDIALKQIQAYSKERELLLARLDESAIEIELEKMRSQLIEKESHLVLLLEDNRSLKKQVRHQSEYLSSVGRDKEDGNDETRTLASYVLVLEERVKRLKVQLETTQKRDRITTNENEKLTKKLEKLTSQKEKQKKQLFAWKEKYNHLEQLAAGSFTDSLVGDTVAGTVTGMGTVGPECSEYGGNADNVDNKSMSAGPGDELMNLLPTFGGLNVPLSRFSTNNNNTQGNKKHAMMLSAVNAHTAGMSHLGGSAVDYPMHGGGSGSGVSGSVGGSMDVTASVGHGHRHGHGHVTSDDDDSDSLSTLKSLMNVTGNNSNAKQQRSDAAYSSQSDLVKKLQKSLDLQREAFIRQLSNVQAELKQSQIENSDLKQKLANLEATSRSQVQS